MTEEQIEMMKSSATEVEWNANVGKVKATHGGYPTDWYEKIVLSGVMKMTVAKFGGSDKIIVY